MSIASSLLARTVILAALAGAAGTAPAAAPISFAYTGNGTITSVPCGPTCLISTVVGVANDWAGMASPIPGSWDVSVTQVVDLAAMTFTGSFSFVDNSGPNSFGGTLVGSFAPMSMTVIEGDSVFTVTGGSGMFAGSTGIGQNNFYADLAAGQYVEAGRFDITPVPEPATWVLLASGLFALSALRRRVG